MGVGACARDGRQGRGGATRGCRPPPPPQLRTPARPLPHALLPGPAPCPPVPRQVSYMILQRVSPVTHSIGNSVKRVVVIASSILVFRNPVTQQVRRSGVQNGGVGWRVEGGGQALQADAGGRAAAAAALMPRCPACLPACLRRTCWARPSRWPACSSTHRSSGWAARRPTRPRPRRWQADALRPTPAA